MLGIAFSGTVDITGVATLLAAIATVALAAMTRGLARSTRSAATATEAEVGAMLARAEEERRPVVVPLVTNQAGFGPAGIPDTAGSLIWLSLKNIGAGPALNLDVRQTKLAAAIVPDRPHEHRRIAGIGVGDIELVPVRALTTPQAAHFDLEITYDDVASKRYRTLASWDPNRQEFAIGFASTAA